MVRQITRLGLFCDAVFYCTENSPVQDVEKVFRKTVVMNRLSMRVCTSYLKTLSYISKSMQILSLNQCFKVYKFEFKTF